MKIEEASIHEVIKRMRLEAGLTQNELGQRMGVSYAAVQQWESGASRPRPARIKELSRVLGTPVTVLMGVANEVASHSPAKRTPLVSWQDLRRWRQDEASKSRPYEPSEPIRWVASDVETGGGAFALTVEGDSMSSFHADHDYPHGTIIIVDPSVQQSVGRKVVASNRSTHDATFKELTVDAGERFLRPLNTQYPLIKLGTDWEIIGVVVSSIYNET